MNYNVCDTWNAEGQSCSGWDSLMKQRNELLAALEGLVACNTPGPLSGSLEERMEKARQAIKKCKENK